MSLPLKSSPVLFMIALCTAGCQNTPADLDNEAVARSEIALVEEKKTGTDAIPDNPSQAIDDAYLDQQIDTHRKADFSVTILDASGRPFKGSVTYELSNHDFEFGTAISAKAIGAPNGDGEDPITAEDIRNYDEVVRKYFNAAVAENAMKWTVMEDEEGPRPDRVHTALQLEQWARERGLFLRGHNIFWGVKRWLPDWQKELALEDPEVLEARMRQRLAHVLGLFEGTVTEWDLNNEMMHQDIFGEAMGWENGAEYFKWAQAIAPDVDFYVNDYGVLQGNEVDRYVAHIRELLDAGASVGGIGDQAHFWKHLPTNEQIWSILDKLGQFDLPVKITEFDIGSYDWHHESQAEMVRRFYRVCFAHPAVDGIYMWGFWERCHWRPTDAFWKRDWSPTPAAETYMKLITEEFMTRGSVESDAHGVIAFRGFFGTYRIEVDGEHYEVSLGKGSPTARIRLGQDKWLNK